MTFKHAYRVVGLSAVTLLLASAVGCSKSEETAQQPARVPADRTPEVYIPPPVEHYEGTPYWLTQSAKWPALLEWTPSADGELEFDSLGLRISGNVIQSFLSGPKSDEHPIICWFELTVRPIPRKLIGYTFNIDSVIFFDPIKKIKLPTLPMLSSERHSEKGVVRTRFSNNLAFLYTPDLVENQLLEPTVYITTVERKSAKLSLSPLTVTFVREIKPEEIPTDSLRWGPS